MLVQVRVQVLVHPAHQVHQVLQGQRFEAPKYSSCEVDPRGFRRSSNVDPPTGSQVPGVPKETPKVLKAMLLAAL